VADVQNIVQMIIDPDGKGIREHWDKTSLMFLVGVVIYVMYRAKGEGRSGRSGISLRRSRARAASIASIPT